MPSTHDTETLLVQHYKGLTQHLKTAWIKVHEEKCALTERNAELLSEVAKLTEAVERARIIQERHTTVPVESFEVCDLPELKHESDRVLAKNDSYFDERQAEIHRAFAELQAENKRVMAEALAKNDREWAECQANTNRDLAETDAVAARHGLQAL